MGDESIIETIKEEIAEAAKAVVAEVKSIATEVADAVESTAALCDEETAPKDEAGGDFRIRKRRRRARAALAEAVLVAAHRELTRVDIGLAAGELI